MDPISKLINRYPELEKVQDEITQAADLLVQVYSEKGKCWCAVTEEAPQTVSILLAS